MASAFAARSPRIHQPQAPRKHASAQHAADEDRLGASSPESSAGPRRTPITGNGPLYSLGNRPPKPGANAQAGPSPGGVIHRLSGPPVHGSVHATSAMPGRWPTDPQHTVKIMRTKSLRRACTLIALLGIASALAACANTFNGMAQDWNNDTHAIQQAFSSH